MAYSQISSLQSTVLCAELILVFVTHRLAFQILPRIYFSCGGVAREMSALKILIRMFGPSNAVVFELRRIILNKKLANALFVLCYIGLGWFIIMDIIILAKQVQSNLSLPLLAY